MNFLPHVGTKSKIPLLKNIKCREHFTLPFSTHSSISGTAKPEGWDEAKPFQCIPGPKELPIIRNNWRFLPIVGRLRNLNPVDMNKMFYEKYGEISRLSGTTLEDLVMVYSIKDIEAIFRNTVSYHTGSTAKAFTYYSASVPDNEHPILAEFGGNAWYEARTKLFPVLMNPQSIMVYAEGIDIIANHLVQKIRDSANLNPNREMPGDFNKYISAWILESVSFICLDKQLAKPEGWDEAKPFQCIPGPKELPIIRNNWRFLPIVGRLRNLNPVDMNKMFYEKYGEISRLSGTTLEDLVMVYSIKDIEAIFRNTVSYHTGSTAKAFTYYSASVPDNEHPILAEFGGNAWYEARTKLFPVLMNPQSIMVYAEGIDIIANHLVQKIRDSANLNPNREMPGDFNKYISAWILESVSFICLDKQLGCLDNNLSEDSEQLKFIRNVNEMYTLFFKIEFEPSVKNIYKTKTWKRFVLVFTSLITTMLKHIEDSIIQINSKVKNNEEATLLKKLLKIDKKLAITTAVNFIIAGVDTTSKLLGSGLYYLAKTQKAQETLRKELLGLLPTKDSPVTKEVLQNAPYLKATIKEITRLAPISVGIFRHTLNDMVLSGYQIPKGKNI